MLRAILPVLLVVLILNSCKKEKYRSYENSGDLILRVYEYFENDTIVSDHSNIKVEIEGTEPLVTGYTDTSGTFLVNDLPMGVYNLNFSKEGFDDSFLQNFQFIGQSEPLNISDAIYEECSITVNDFDVKFENDTFIVTGNISHNLKNLEINNHRQWPGIAVFCNISRDYTDYNYNRGFRSYTMDEDVNKFSLKVPLRYFYRLDEPPSTCYIAVCGYNKFYSRTEYSYEKNTSVRHGYGPISEIKTIEILK